MFCRFCGTQLNDNAVFCNNCGNRLKNGKANVVDYSTLSLGGEIKKSKFLFIIPFISLLWSFLRSYLFRNSIVMNNMTYVEIVSIANIVVQGFFWGALSYASIKRSVKFSLILMIPYLVYAAGYPFIFDSFQYLTESASSLVDYIGGIIIPFAVFGMLRIIKILMSNIKSRWPVGIVSVVVAMLMFSIYLVAIYWVSYTEHGMSLQLPTAMLLLYAASIMVSNILMNIVYKAR